MLDIYKNKRNNISKNIPITSPQLPFLSNPSSSSPSQIFFPTLLNDQSEIENHCQIHHTPLSTLTPEEFYSQYVKLNRPLLIKIDVDELKDYISQSKLINILYSLILLIILLF